MAINLNYDSLNKEFEKVESRYASRINIARTRQNDTQLADFYFEKEAEKQALRVKASHEEDTKVKLTESMLLEEFEQISPVANKAYLNLYLKKRLGKDYTSSKLRGVWDLLRADMESYTLANQPKLLNTWDGVYNIDSQTVEHRKPINESGLHDKFISHYDPTAKAPTFEKVLNDLNTEANPDLGEDLLKMYAYCTFGGNKLKTMFILWGDGDDGKSLIQNAIRTALGNYVAVVAPKKIRYSRGKDDQFQTWLAGMDGKKFATVSEWGESDRLDNAVVKQIVSGGGSVAELEQKNQNEQKEIKLTAPFVLDTNFLPDVTNVEPALLKRIAVLKFNRQYSEDEKDKDLDEKLKAERAGILNMIINAYDPNWRVPEKYREQIKIEHQEQQSEVDDLILYALRSGNIMVDVESNESMRKTLVTQNPQISEILRRNHIKIKQVDEFLKTKGVKLNNRGDNGKQYVGLRYADNISNRYNRNSELPF